MAQIMVQNPGSLVFLLLGWLLLMLFAWRRRFKPYGAFLLRLAIIVLVALALSRPVFLPSAAKREAGTQRTVLLVDQSASLGETGQASLRIEAARLSQEIPNTITMFFGDEPVLVPVSNDGPILAELPFDLEQSNLADALSMGAELLNNQPGRLVLLSDGIPTSGDTLAVTTQLAQQGIPVDVLIPKNGDPVLWASSPNEVHLVKLDVPPVLRQGETVDLEVTVHTIIPTEATLRLTRTSSETVLAEDVVLLEPGLNLFTFAVEAETLGPQTFRATVTAHEDGQSANNSFSAFSQVYPPPRILVVSDEVLPGVSFADELQKAGFDSNLIQSEALPDRLSELESFAGMVLLNVSARALELEQMIAVQEFVRSLGRGLLVTGGRDSFSLGGYEDTPLADLLPVSLEPPPREERPPVALLLIIDHSGSMVEKHGTAELLGAATKLAMAKEAAIRATDMLGPEDLIGVLMFDNEYEWIVPFQPVNDGAALLEIQQSIATIAGGGGTRILKALEVGLPALAEQDAASAARHAVLLSDGKSYDGNKGPSDYDLVVDAAQDANITLSTIAIGSSADQVLLTHLAERGRGRYHFAAVPEELPALTIAESDILRSNALQEGEFSPSIFKPHPILRGLFTGSVSGDVQLPDLDGYIAMTPRPQAEVALQMGPGDPLLSVWGYGLGRVAAWASDTGQEWAVNLSTWPDAARFWGQLVGYTLPGPELDLLQLNTGGESDGVVTVTADSTTTTGQTVDLAPTQAILTTPGGREISLNLRQVAPGRYQQRLRLPDPGAYQVRVTQTRNEEPDEMVTTGFVLSYPAEYALPEEGTAEIMLKQIAATTGGQTFALGEVALPAAVQPDTDSVSQEPQELWPWLLLAALILWPLEIAWRRWGRLRIQ